MTNSQGHHDLAQGPCLRIVSVFLLKVLQVAELLVERVHTLQEMFGAEIRQ